MMLPYCCGCATQPSMGGATALGALEHSLYARPPINRFVDPGDRGVQYLAIRYTEPLLSAGINCSVGNIGDSYKNALDETLGAVFKTDVIGRHGPWRNVQHVEFASPRMRKRKMIYQSTAFRADQTHPARRVRAAVLRAALQ